MKRTVLLTVLLLEGIGALCGGILLTVAPDGHSMKIPVQVLHDTFPNFLIPGMILTGMGVVTLVAFMSVLKRSLSAWYITSIALIGLTIWFAVEIAIIRELHWLHIVWGTPVLVGMWSAIPLIHEGKE